MAGTDQRPLARCLRHPPHHEPPEPHGVLDLTEHWLREIAQSGLDARRVHETEASRDEELSCALRGRALCDPVEARLLCGCELSSPLGDVQSDGVSYNFV